MTNRILSIKKLANYFITRFRLTPPVNLEEIYSELKIELVEESNQYGIEAFSDLSEHMSVCINPEITYYEPRKRFTLAHELGHICIPWHNGDIKCETDNNYIQINGKKLLDTQELEANIFASEILMPTAWLNNEIACYLKESFFTLLENVSRDAKTSIMASLFALEDKLPSGHIYFIKNTLKDYWMTFKSKNTFTVSWNYCEEENIKFLDSVCERKESRFYTQYEIIYYELLPCPDSDIIKNIYNACSQDLNLFLKRITGNHPIKSLTFMDAILKFLPEKYAAYIIFDDKIVKRICDAGSPLSAIGYGLGIEDIFSACKHYNFDTVRIKLENSYEIIFIKEKVFVVSSYEKCEPNSLLKKIVNDIYFSEDIQHMLQSINGLISSINSMYHNGSREELYNWAKYKFYMNKKYKDFCEHPDFEKYIINKIDDMISKRR